MALHRGIQSAIFFYLSCAPCADARYRKKMKEDAERGRLERVALAAEMPNLYRHPSPSSTNPYWRTEIDAGPVVVGRRWKGYSEDPRKKGKTSTTQPSQGSDRPSSVDVVSVGESGDGRDDGTLHVKHYQRHDDELWGSTSTERLGFSRSWQSAGVAIPERAHTRGSDNSGKYVSLRNPQINDLHPATVTKINSRADARWMFQPNPTADVMLGKTRAPRSRSDSGNSSRVSARSAVPLSRDLSQRMVERRLKTPEHSVAMSRESSARTAQDAGANPQESPETALRDFAKEEPMPHQQQQRPNDSSTEQPSEDSGETAVTVVRTRDTDLGHVEPPHPRNVAAKPRLPTIASEDASASGGLPFTDPSVQLFKENGIPGARASDTSLSSPLSERDRLSRRSALVTKDDSLRVLQELAPSSRIFKTQVISPDELLVRASKKRMPSQDRIAAGHADLDPDPDLLEAWDTADFALPEWIHEHTKREVKERWSMDI